MNNRTKNILPLSVTNPDLAKEWNQERNGSLKLDDFSCGSHKNVWWKCGNGHEWEALISNRVRLGRGCPYCAGQRVIKGINDLSTVNPELAKQWNYERNAMKPYEVAAGTHKKAWWICPEGHEWEAEIKSRASGIGCPVCNGKKVLKGFNDLETVNPDLAKDWHPTKNEPLKPSEVTSVSGKKVWWICRYGHEYQAAVYNRKKGSGCPLCAKASRSSFPEQAIYYYVKKQFPDAVNGYRDIFSYTMELDVFIPSIKVGIEYDGKVYHSGKDNQIRDSRKYNICKKNGIMLVRVVEIKRYTPLLMCDHKIEIPSADDRYLDYAISSLLFHLGKPADVNVKRDRNEILSLLDKRKVSLTDEYPDVAKEWDYEVNHPLVPENLPPHSNEKVGWICAKCGNRWKAAIGDRTRAKANGCPKCASAEGGQKRVASLIKVKGSIVETNPELLEEWDYDKNTGISPEQLTSGSGRKVWWICRTCGYSWKTNVGHRTSGRGCPSCSGKIVRPGINDLKTLYPEIAREWDAELNYPSKPDQFLPKSGKKFWWKCSKCGNRWQTAIHVRTSGHNCPKCSRNKNLEHN